MMGAVERQKWALALLREWSVLLRTVPLMVMIWSGWDRSSSCGETELMFTSTLPSARAGEATTPVMTAARSSTHVISRLITGPS